MLSSNTLGLSLTSSIHIRQCGLLPQPSLQRVRSIVMSTLLPRPQCNGQSLPPLVIETGTTSLDRDDLRYLSGAPFFASRGQETAKRAGPSSSMKSRRCCQIDFTLPESAVYNPWKYARMVSKCVGWFLHGSLERPTKLLWSVPSAWSFSRNCYAGYLYVHRICETISKLFEIGMIITRHALDSAYVAEPRAKVYISYAVLYQEKSDSSL